MSSLHKKESHMLIKDRKLKLREICTNKPCYTNPYLLRHFSIQLTTLAHAPLPYCIFSFTTLCNSLYKCPTRTSSWGLHFPKKALMPHKTSIKQIYMLLSCSSILCQFNPQTQPGLKRMEMKFYSPTKPLFNLIKWCERAVIGCQPWPTIFALWKELKHLSSIGSSISAFPTDLSCGQTP